MTVVDLPHAEHPTEATVEELLSWSPPHGVLSICIDVDPADRSGRELTQVRGGLKSAGKAIADHDREGRLALERTIERVQAVLPAVLSDPHGRALVGFVEVALKAGEERWFSAGLRPRRTEVSYGKRPRVGSLIALLDDGAPLGAAVMARDAVRVFDWHLGRTTEVASWEFEQLSRDWRERKSPRPRDPARARAVKSSGRDQHNERVEANRERFAGQAGGLVAALAHRHDWRLLMVFGDERSVGPFRSAFGGACELRHVDHSNLITQTAGSIAERIDLLVPDLIRERERALIEQARRSAQGSPARASIGRSETLQALEDGRVAHLVLDENVEGEDLDRMIELALKTGAAVTPVGGSAGSELGAREGALALLRY